MRNKYQEIESIYYKPLLDLIYQAATIHRQYNDVGEVQVCTLLSIKTGGCPEDCAYCPQAARYHTDVTVQSLMKTDDVLNSCKESKRCRINQVLYGRRLA